jgi:hypothetical protein
MRLFTVQAFDDIISGTGEVWHSPASLSDLLGSADALLLQAVTTDVAGASPTLTCRIETSANGKDWLFLGFPAAIDAQAMANDKVLHGEYGAISFFLHFVRLRISLGGTDPRCRLKVYAAGHVLQNAPEAANGHHPVSPAKAAGRTKNGNGRENGDRLLR